MADLGGSRVERRRQKRRRVVVVVTAICGVLALVAIAAVAVVVTREDDAETAEVAPRSRRTTTSTSATTTTAVPVSTTVVPRSADPVVALAQQYDGRYVGTFTNTTFNTTGPATLELVVDPATGQLLTRADFDGDLFGGGAKAVRRIEGTAKLGDPNGSITIDTEAFGPVSGRLDDSLQLILTADDVPGAKVKGFTLTGRLREDLTGFDATYTVTFEDAKTADGTVALSCDQAGSRTNEVPTICALSQGAATP